MNNTLNEVTFSNLNGFLPIVEVKSKQKEKTMSIELFATFIKKLSGYNMTISLELAEYIFNSSEQTGLKMCTDILKTLESKMGNKDYKPFFKNFPDEVIDMHTEVKYIYALSHYFFGFVPEETAEFKEKELSEVVKSEIIPLSELKLLKKNDVISLAKNLMSSNVTLSDSMKNDLFIIIDNLSNSEIEKMLEDTDIVIKETIVSLGLYLSERNIMLPSIKTATDVLRLIFEMSKEYNLDRKFNNKFINFKKFSRKEIRSLYSLLENIGYLVDDMNPYKKVWKKFFVRTKDRIDIEKYPKVNFAYLVLNNKETYETVAYKLEKAYLDLKNNDSNDIILEMELLNKLLTEYKTRPGYFARNLVALITLNTNLNTSKLIINQFISVIEGVNSRVLYQIISRLENIRDQERIVRIGTNYVTLEDKHKENIDDSTIKYIVDLLKGELSRRASKKESMGLVYIDEKLMDIKLSTSERQSNSSLRPMTTGSRIPFNKDSDVLRLFIGWENIKNESGESRVDIDLSADYFDTEFKNLGNVSYYSVTDSDILFSGDITDAPEGAMEYIDITNREKLISRGVRYIVMTITSFTGQKFSDIPVSAGVLELTKKEAREKKNFYKSGTKFGFEINNESTNCYTIVVDLSEGNYIWLDSSVYTKLVSGANVGNLRENSNSIIKYLINKKYTSVYDLLKLNAESRGVILDTLPEDESTLEKVTVFKAPDESNPLNLPEIFANFI